MHSRIDTLYSDANKDIHNSQLPIQIFLGSCVKCVMTLKDDVEYIFGGLVIANDILSSLDA